MVTTTCRFIGCEDESSYWRSKLAAFADLSLTDGQGTPVSHPFQTSYRRVLPNGRLEYAWADYSVNSGVPVGANTLRLWVTPLTPAASTKSGGAGQQQVIEGMFQVPTMSNITNSTVSGIAPQPQVEFYDSLWFKILRPGRSAQQNSKDVVAFLRAFVLTTQFTDLAYTLKTPT